MSRKIKKIRLKGFQSHKNTELELHPGVNIIVGEPDSGKSALFRSLYWLNFNRPLGDAYVDRKANECFVEVVTDDGNSISRSKVPSSNYKINGQNYSFVGSSVPTELKGALNLDELNFQSQLKDQYFLVLDSPGQVSRTISDLLGFSVIDGAVASCKNKLTGLSTTINEKTLEAKRVGKVIEDTDTIHDIERSIHLIEEEGERLERCIEEVEGIRKLITSITNEQEFCSNSSLLNDINVLEADLLLNKGMELSTSLIHIKSLINEAEDYSKKVKEEKILLLEYENKVKIEELKLICNNLKNLCSEVEKSKNQINTLSVEIKKVGVKIEEKSNEYVETLNRLKICPYCFSSVNRQSVERALGY
jgi:chromosome segregation ATPase